MKNNLKSLALCGPSGIGKTTILESFLQHNETFREPISYQTRPLRKGEKNKIYIPEEEFKEREEDNQFSFISSYNGCKYGIALEDIEKIRKKDLNIAMDFALDNIHVLTRLEDLGYTLNTFYLLPSSTSKLINRLKIRYDGKMGKFKERRNKSLCELSRRYSHSNWRFISGEIINGNINETLKKIEEHMQNAS